MKKIIFCAALLLSITAFAAEFIFADNGKAKYTIVIPEKTAEFEDLAAKDLQNFFGKMSNAKFQIVKESAAPKNNAIYIGRTNFAKKAAVNAEKLTPETWVIKPVGNNLILAGGYPIGSFYAVWNLLNKFDCYTLTWEMDAVPSYKTLKKDIAAEQKKPVFDGRWVSDGVAGVMHASRAKPEVMAAYRMYKLRNWMNGGHRPNDHLWKYGPYNYNHFPAYHGLVYHYVPLKWFKTNPEYFAMDRFGKRVRPRTSMTEGCVCMSNPEVVKVALDSLRNMIKKERAKLPREKWATLYDISTLDIAPDLCKCPKCLAITNEEGSQTGLLLRFINEITNEIRKEYPELTIRTFGYSASRQPPTKTVPTENVLIQLADQFVVSNPFRPLTDPLNAGRIPYFKEWGKKAKSIMVWDYWNLYTEMPDTVFNSIQPDLRFFRDNNVCGLYLQAGGDRFKKQSFIQLTHFVAAQLMLDPEKDPKKLADLYLKYYYGPAAPRMSKLFYDICEGVRKDKKRQNSAVVAHWDFLTPEFVYQTYVDLKKITNSLPENNIYRKHVEQELLAFVWYIAYKKYFYAKIFNANGIKNEQIIAECKDLALKHIRRFPARTHAGSEKRFYNKAKVILSDLKRPEKFKDVPDENFRMIAYPHFIKKTKTCTYIVDDPESIQGKAVKTNMSEEYHGADRIMPGPDRFPATEFRWGNHKMPGRVSLTVKNIPQDEKYHWYRMPGKLELRPISYFSGHAWAFQAETSHLYTFAEGDAKDNLWNEVWFSAKFTGPAYVKGSKKENAIYVDMAVLVRNEKAMSSVSVKESMFPAPPAKTFPQGWVYDRKNTKLEHKDGKTSAVINSNGRIVGPYCKVSVGDTLSLKLKTSVPKCRAGFFFYDKDRKYIGSKLFNTTASADNFSCETAALKFSKGKKAEDIAYFRITVMPPKNTKAYNIDDLEVKISKNK